MPEANAVALKRRAKKAAAARITAARRWTRIATPDEPFPPSNPPRFRRSVASDLRNCSPHQSIHPPAPGRSGRDREHEDRPVSGEENATQSRGIQRRPASLGGRSGTGARGRLRAARAAHPSGSRSRVSLKRPPLAVDSARLRVGESRDHADSSEPNGRTTPARGVDFTTRTTSEGAASGAAPNGSYSISYRSRAPTLPGSRRLSCPSGRC